MKQQSILVLGSLCLSVSLLFSACGQTPETKETEEESAAIPSVIELSQEAIRLADIQTEKIGTRSVGAEIVSTGILKADDNNTFHISSFVNGRIARDNVVLGQSVSQGQTLAVIQNLEIAKIQAEYIHELHQNEIDTAKARTQYELAKKNLARERQLLEEGISPRSDYQQAEAAATIAKTELHGQNEHKIHIKAEGRALMGAYGVSPGNSEHIRSGSPILAPRKGIITKKNVTLGDMVTPDTVMYEVMDLSQIWLDISVYSKDIANIKLKQPVLFTTDSLPGKTFPSTIDYLQPVASENNATYTARAVLQNPQGLLKPGMFGKVQIEQGQLEATAFVPDNAVQKYGRETFVFVPLANHKYQKKTVTLGNKVQDGYLVKSGIKAGDTVVTKGSFTLKAELLKSQFAEEE